MIIIRTIIVAIYVLVVTVCSYPGRIYRKWKYKDGKERYDTNYHKLHVISRRILKILGIRVMVDGSLAEDANENYLFVGNHRSDFDSLILVAQINKPIIFIGKSEIKKMPFIGKWFTEIGCIFIDREDAKESLAAIVKGIERLKNGYSLVIFPEGGRTKENGIRDFKPGSMKLATKSGVKIIPLTFYNTEACYELQHRFQKATVKLVIGTPLDMEKDELKNTTEIANYLHDMIAQKYREMDLSVR